MRKLYLRVPHFAEWLAESHSAWSAAAFFPRLETIVSMCRAINNTQGQHFEQVSYTLVYTLHLTSTKDGRNKKKARKEQKKEKRKREKARRSRLSKRERFTETAWSCHGT